ncbi:MAG: T9SS type A sorting domain-containing protein, partial [Bacteroides sp.]|nr:T9SS type A sorting domain-containing protein [Bacteroides sp.]
VEEPITFTAFKGDNATTGMRFWTNGLRFFKNSECGFTLKAAEGKVIKSVVLDLDGATFALPAAEGETATNITSWEGEAQELTFNYTNTGNKDLCSVTVVYGDPTPQGTYYTVSYTGEHGKLLYTEGVDMFEIPAEGVRFPENANLFVMLSLDEGYRLSQMTMNGQDVTADFAKMEYSIMELSSDIAFEATITEQVEREGSILIPATQFGSGKTIQQLRFDDVVLGSHTNGVNDDADHRSRNLTYSAWVNLKNISNNQVVMGNIQNEFADALGAFRVVYKDNKLQLQGRNAKNISEFADAVISESTDPGTIYDEWMFLSVVADQDAHTVTLYKNCQPISSYSTDYGVGILTDPACFFISDRGASIAVNEIQLWTKALTLDELKDTYNFNPETIPAELVAYYKSTEFVDGSDTDLRNLGSEGTTVAQVISGRYDLINGWLPQFSNITPENIEMINEERQLKMVSASVAQPNIEGASAKLVLADGSDLPATFPMFTKVNVQASLPEDINIVSINVQELHNNVDYTLTPDELPIRPADDVYVTLRLDDRFHVSASVENGSVKVAINDGVDLPMPSSGTDIDKGSKVVFKFTPDNSTYKLTSFTVNGEDAIESLVDGTYTVASLTENVEISAVYQQKTYHLSVINPTDEASISYKGEICNNYMQPIGDGVDVDVAEGSVIYFMIQKPADTKNGTALLSVKDNDVEIKNNLHDMGTYGLMYNINGVREDHTFVVSQDIYAAILGVGSDGNGVSYANGILTAPEGSVIEVVDLNGRTVASANAAQLSIVDLAAGVYVARVTTPAGETVTLKFAKF